MGRFLVLYMCLLASVINADEWYQITPKWKFNQTQLDLFVSQLNRTTEESYLYHWGDLFSSLRWAKQNSIDQKEMDFLDAGVGIGGGGFYVSTTKYDSRIYGVFPTVVHLPAGALLFESADIPRTSSLLQILDYNGTRLDLNDKVKLGAVIPFVDKYSYGYKTWRVVHSAKLTQDVMPGHIAPEPHRVDFRIALPVLGQFDNGPFSALSKMKETEIFDDYKDNINDVERLFSLLELLGPVEMNCRLQLKEDIWRGVDTMSFDSYHRLRMHIYSMIENSVSIGFGLFFYGFIGKNYPTTPISWIRNQTEKVLPELHNYAHNSIDDMWRGEEKTLHIGNGTITVVPKQLEYIQANPYLHVKVVSTYGNHTKVQIWLPDVLHYNSTLVTNTTDALIQSYTVAQLEKDSHLRQKLNRVLCKDMLENMMSAVYGKFYTTDLCRGLVFLSPLTDMELARLWCWKGATELMNEQNSVAPCNLIYRGMEYSLNPDISETDRFYVELQSASHFAVSNATTSTMLYMGDHIQKPEEKRWFTDGWSSMTSARPAHLWKFVLPLPLDKCEMTREKKWTEILDEVSPQWMDHL